MSDPLTCNIANCLRPLNITKQSMYDQYTTKHKLTNTLANQVCKTLTRTYYRTRMKTENVNAYFNITNIVNGPRLTKTWVCIVL